jgi:hypothetical protein
MARFKGWNTAPTFGGGPLLRRRRAPLRAGGGHAVDALQPRLVQHFLLVALQTQLPRPFLQCSLRVGSAAAGSRQIIEHPSPSIYYRLCPICRAFLQLFSSLLRLAPRWPPLRGSGSAAPAAAAAPAEAARLCLQPRAPMGRAPPAQRPQPPPAAPRGARYQGDVLMLGRRQMQHETLQAPVRVPQTAAHACVCAIWQFGRVPLHSTHDVTPSLEDFAAVCKHVPRRTTCRCMCVCKRRHSGMSSMTP